MTLADEMSAVWDAARGELADAFHGDRYEVLRTARTESPGGGWTEQPEAVVESGRCALLEGAGFGGEETDEHVIAVLSAYRAELPIDSVVEAGDRLRINGDVYLIDDVRRGGNHRLFAVAELRWREVAG